MTKLLALLMSLIWLTLSIVLLFIGVLWGIFSFTSCVAAVAHFTCSAPGSLAAHVVDAYLFSQVLYTMADLVFWLAPLLLIGLAILGLFLGLQLGRFARLRDQLSVILCNAGFSILFAALLLISYGALERSVPAWASRVCGQLLADSGNPLCTDLLAAGDNQLSNTLQPAALTTLRTYLQITAAPRLAVYELVIVIVGSAALLTLAAWRSVPKMLPFNVYSAHHECATCGRWLTEDSLCPLCNRYLSVAAPPLEHIYTYTEPIDLPIILRRGAAQSPINNLWLAIEMSPLFTAVLNDPAGAFNDVQLTPLTAARGRDRTAHGVLLTWSDQADCLHDEPLLYLTIGLSVIDKPGWQRARQQAYLIKINAQADLMTPAQATHQIIVERPATPLERGRAALWQRFMRRVQPAAAPAVIH